MDRMLYVGMTGAQQAMKAQNVNNNNLANANTAGFRADTHDFRSAEIEGPGYRSRVNAVAEGRGTDFSEGSMQTTERDMDVAVQGDGWIAVQAPDGEEAYTRAGDLRVNANGILTNGSGHPVLGDAGPVAVPPHDELSIGNDGTVSIVPQGQTGDAMAMADRIKLVNPDEDDLVKGEDGLMRMDDGEAADADADVRLATGVLEGSNVSATESLVNMIQLSRSYEMQVKTMQTADENSQAASELLRSAG